MAKKFQNLTVDYGKLVGKMSVSDRLSLLRSGEGQNLLSSLTPYQLAEMFPDYYKKQYPDVGAILKSVSSPSFKPSSAAAAAESMEIDRRRLRSGERINYPRPEVTPRWLRKLEEETGVKLSDPGAKAKLSNEKKALLDELSKGKISADDPRVGFLKNLSDEDLIKAGIKKQTDANGKTVFERAATAASTMSDAEVADKLRSEAQTSFSPRERAVLDIIAKREGSTNQDIVFGDTGGVAGSGKYSKELGLDKRPLSDRSVAEVLDLQKQLTQLTRRDGHGGGRGTSAVGTGQMIRETLISNLRALGIPESEWPNIKFDKNLQERLTIQNFKSSGIGDPNSDPSTWNMRALGQQYESLDTTKGFRGLSDTERQMIAQASPTKPAPGPVTAEAITTKRKQLEQQEREQQQTFLAERTIPKLPEGVDAKIVEIFDKLSPARKQDVLAMLEKAGNGDTSRGIARVNQLYKENPMLVQEGIFRGNGKLLFSDQSVAERSAQLNPYMQNTLNKFQEFAPPGTTITSTYRSPEHHIERRKMVPGAHTRGAAIDLRTEGKSREELARTIQALKRAGFTKILLEGDHIHAEANPGQGFHISNLGMGNPNIDLRTAYEASSAVAFNEELPGNQKDREEAKPAQTATVEPTPAPTVGAGVTTTQVAPQAQQVSQSQTQVPNVEVYAEGGKYGVNSGEIKAMPIESLKGDNSVVVDGANNPLFTMNTKEEHAVYNPKTRQVDVQPLTKTDPNQLGGRKQNTEALTENVNLVSKQNQIQPVTTPMSDPMNRSSDTSVAITDELFKDPSFKRAIAKTRFVDTGDAALGGHFGMANADLG